MGGSGHLETLKTLKFEYRSPGRDEFLKWEIIRPNLVRKEREGELVLLFDGQRAGFLEGPVQEDGTLEGPHLVPEEDWHHFEMDIALYIPAFFDHPAVHAGRTTVDGDPAHLLRVALPMGGIAVYAIDAESFLPIRVDLPDWDLQQRLGDFREVGGILYPHRFWSASDPSQVTVLENLEVNGELDRSRFVFPDFMEGSLHPE
jgi:hypothetical protein